MSELSNEPFTFVACGELQGSTTALQLPDIVSAGLVYFKALGDNAGYVYLGGAAVTKADGTTDVTSGFQLKASESIALNVDNLSRLWRICDNAGDDLVYIITR